MQDDSEKLRNELQNAELEMTALRTELRKALEEADRACAQMWLFFEHISRRTETSPRPAADETKSPADAVIPPPHQTKSPADTAVPPPHETKSPADTVVRPPPGSLTAKMRQFIEHLSHRTAASPPPVADEVKSPADAALTAIPAEDVCYYLLHIEDNETSFKALPAAAVRPCVLHIEDNETSFKALPAAAVRPYVLHIEDSEMSFGLVQQILQEIPEIDLHWADCGRTGLNEVQARVPDLILLDLDLPDMHGSQVLLTLQKEPATAGIPVIVISADATPSQIERMLTAGARDYLTKPFDIRRFLIMVEKNLEGAVAGNGAAAWTPALV